jgi:hypothetical protein
MPPDEVMSERIEVFAVLNGMRSRAEGTPLPSCTSIVQDASKSTDELTERAAAFARINSALVTARWQRQAVVTAIVYDLSAIIDTSEYPRTAPMVKYRAAERRSLGHRGITLRDDDE